MNVKITKDSKKVITLAEMPTVKRIISELKEYDDNLKDMARQVARLVNIDLCFGECLKAEAEICKYYRTMNLFFEGSGNFDVYLKFYLYDGLHEFVDISLCLSELWKMDGTPETADEILKHSYIRRFKLTESAYKGY